MPEFSFNIIADAPGCGKTTLAHQLMFANATDERLALYFTLLGEPALKMLPYPQQYDFFDITKLKKSIRFVNLCISQRAKSLSSMGTLRQQLLQAHFSSLHKLPLAVEYDAQ